MPLEVHAREVRAGMFERRWSNLTVSFDCDSYTGSFEHLEAVSSSAIHGTIGQPIESSQEPGAYRYSYWT